MRQDCDVIVLGGGPGGSTLASFLALRDRRAILLEREKFPRFHIGESLLPCSCEVFEKLGVKGVLDQKFLRMPVVQDEAGLRRFLRHSPAELLSRRDYGADTAGHVRRLLGSGVSGLVMPCRSASAITWGSPMLRLTRTVAALAERMSARRSDTRPMYSPP